MVVEVQQQAPMDSAHTTITGFWNFLVSSWVWILIFILIIILFVVIWYLFKKLEDERKERDEPNYAAYKSIVSTCKLRANPRRIRKKWNWKSIFLIFIPFPPIWILIPFIKSEHSDQYVDAKYRLIGYYRGEFRSMDGTIYALMYKEKFMVFFERLFVVKIPIILPYRIEEKDKKTGETKLTEIKKINLSNKFIQMGKDDTGHTRIVCNDIEKLGQYYFCPVYDYEFDGHGDVLDYRKIMEASIADNTNYLFFSQLTNQLKNQMEKMVYFNPSIVAAQKMPEKTKEDVRNDEA